MKHQPIIIEVTRIEGDNEVGFALRGSAEWLKEMEPFINYTSTFLFARLNQDPDFLAQGRAEMLAAFDAMQRRESYQGEYVTLKMNQELPQ